MRVSNLVLFLSIALVVISGITRASENGRSILEFSVILLDESIEIRLQSREDDVRVEVPSLGMSLFVLKNYSGSYELAESPIKGPLSAPRLLVIHEGEFVGVSLRQDYLRSRYDIEKGEEVLFLYSPSHPNLGQDDVALPNETEIKIVF